MVTNIALMIKNNLIIFNHMDAYHSYIQGWRYFVSPHYLVSKAWIKATVLFHSLIKLTGTYVSMYMKMFPGVVRYWNSCIPFHCIKAVIDVTHSFILTAYPSL